MAIKDISVWGEQNIDGTAKELVDDEAISNAMQLFIMSKKGDYILDPTIGGPLNAYQFKNMDSNNIEILRFSLQNALYMKFGGYITVEDIVINPDYTNRFTEVIINYTSLLSSEQNSATIYINDTSKTNIVTYTDIAYIEDNLYTFVQIKKPDMQGRKLVYNITELSWIWGNNFKFINFTTDDPRFEDILAYCNV